MFANLVSEIVAILKSYGLKAGRAYPGEKIRRENGCFVRVRLESLRQSEAGMAGYLGTQTDADGIEREVYGMRCDIELALDIYASNSGSNAAGDCETTVDELIFALGECQGLSITSISCGGAKPDRDTGLFLCPCRAAISAILTLESGEDSLYFSDFILKGEIKK